MENARYNKFVFMEIRGEKFEKKIFFKVVKKANFFNHSDVKIRYKVLVKFFCK